MWLEEHYILRYYFLCPKSHLKFNSIYSNNGFMDMDNNCSTVTTTTFHLQHRKAFWFPKRQKEIYPTFGSYLVIYGITNVKVLFWANLFIVYDKWYNSKRNGMSPKKFLCYKNSMMKDFFCVSLQQPHRKCIPCKTRRQSYIYISFSLAFLSKYVILLLP